MRHTIGTALQLEAFINSFYISDYDHEMMYGDTKVAKDMEKDKLV
jgi:hypothetical protein